MEPRTERRLHRLVSLVGIAAAEVGYDTLVITTVPAGCLITEVPRVFRVHLPPEIPPMPESDAFTEPIDPDFPPDYDDQLIQEENRAVLPHFFASSSGEDRAFLEYVYQRDRERARRAVTYGRKAE